MDFAKRFKTILLCAISAWMLSGCLASMPPVQRPSQQGTVDKADPPPEILLDCEERLPPLQGSLPEGKASSGDLLIWKQDADKTYEDCRLKVKGWQEFHKRDRGQ